jgi:hypothetical protein
MIASKCGEIVELSLEEPDKYSLEISPLIGSEIENLDTKVEDPTRFSPTKCSFL